MAQNRIEVTISVDPAFRQRLNERVEQMAQLQDGQRENYLMRYFWLDPDELAQNHYTLATWRDDLRRQTMVEIRDVNGVRIRTLPVDDEQLHRAETSFRRIATAFTGLGSAAMGGLAGSLAEFGRATVQAAARAEELQLQRLIRWAFADVPQPVPLSFYSFSDNRNRDLVIGLRDESSNTQCEQRISEVLLRQGRAPDSISMATERLGELMLAHLRERGGSQEQIELTWRFIREHIYRGFVWGTPRRSTEEVSLCHCPVCDRQRGNQRTPGHKDASALEAESRARDLLLSCLTPTQQEKYESTWSFEVKTKSGNRYRIERQLNYNVLSLDKKGQPVSRLCAGLVEAVPVYDQMLAQKLMLETDEAEFLAVANRTAFTPDYL